MITKEQAIQAAEEIVDNHPLLETVEELFEAARMEKYFDKYDEDGALAIWGRLNRRVRNAAPLTIEEDINYFSRYFIHIDESSDLFVAGRKAAQFKYQTETFSTYKEAQSYIDDIESLDKENNKGFFKDFEFKSN